MYCIEELTEFVYETELRSCDLPVDDNDCISEDKKGYPVFE